MAGGQDKTHIDYAYELDITVKPDSRVPVFNREFATFTGAGVPLFSLGGGPARYALAEVLAKFHARRGYYVVETPIIASTELFKVSGHIEFYRKNMYLFDIEGHEFAVKPMNCPYHILLFLNEVAKHRSKLPLPFKVFEFGRVHRYEPSGSIYGLLRVRGFTQDDAHIIVPGGMVIDVVYNVFEEMKLVLEKLFKLGVSPETFKVRLSMSDKSLIGKEFMGSREEWEGAEEALREAAGRINEKYGIEVVELEGEAAFYGPKLDFIMILEESGVSKEWQMGTIQFDFNLPRRFRLYEVVREEFGIEEVYIIHRALLGSIERFLGVYLEHRKGRMPFTLAPIQFAVIAVKTGDEVDREIDDLARGIAAGLLERGFRVALKESSKTGLSSDVRHIESTAKPAANVFIGAKEVGERVLDVRVFDLEAMKRRRHVIPYSDVGDAVDKLARVAEELEEPVRSLAGQTPRIPADFSFML
ncbi:aminoacyl--tRNA ligase-related protein [Aeropyrum camini]|uniref:Threonine--tRNA ligase catalytic subunit n=1 Tax=Aeropyrum camini SY1 = JCM 12091 TaxID=1198449 RepID=U3TDJ0_9CREN|nr:aminoacyl--tRNA ligase-related protein [Aeropyrum camini]BAN90038.1 threonyl-tRNA synthetase [Aeropyrum camini SY1 = JCM 12091]